MFLEIFRNVCLVKKKKLFRLKVVDRCLGGLKKQGMDNFAQLLFQTPFVM